MDLALGRRERKIRGSSHLFVGVKLFVCLMPEPAMKPGRNVRSGKKIGIIVNTSNIPLPSFSRFNMLYFKFFISEMRMATGNDTFRQHQAFAVAGKETSPSQSTRLLLYPSFDLPDFPSRHHPHG